MAFDPPNGTAVLFGGVNNYKTKLFGDTGLSAVFGHSTPAK
jgi:hypothetical protein